MIGKTSLFKIFGKFYLYDSLDLILINYLCTAITNIIVTVQYCSLRFILVYTAVYTD